MWHVKLLVSFNHNVWQMHKKVSTPVSPEAKISQARKTFVMRVCSILMSNLVALFQTSIFIWFPWAVCSFYFYHALGHWLCFVIHCFVLQSQCGEMHGYSICLALFPSFHSIPLVTFWVVTFITTMTQFLHSSLWCMQQMFILHLVFVQKEKGHILHCLR